MEHIIMSSNPNRLQAHVCVFLRQSERHQREGMLAAIVCEHHLSLAERLAAHTTVSRGCPQKNNARIPPTRSIRSIMTMGLECTCSYIQTVVLIGLRSSTGIAHRIHGSHDKQEHYSYVAHSAHQRSVLLPGQGRRAVQTRNCHPASKAFFLTSGHPPLLRLPDVGKP